VAGGGGTTAVEGNEAYSHYSAILGGHYNDTGDGISPTVGQYATVSGGYFNRASGDASSVSGGVGRSVSGQYNWAACDAEYFCDQ